jgi:hypothetical protein
VEGEEGVVCWCWVIGDCRTGDCCGRPLLLAVMQRPRRMTESACFSQEEAADEASKKTFSGTVIKRESLKRCETQRHTFQL